MKKTETTIETTTEVKVKGRKVNNSSARQIRIAELVAKREAGLLKKGRPIQVDSKRQQKLANGVSNKRGRPVNLSSERQVRLAKVGTAKRGRPAKETV